MSQTLLTAVSRPTATKGQVRRLRAEGKLPAVIYDRHGQSRPDPAGRRGVRQGRGRRIRKHHPQAQRSTGRPRRPSSRTARSTGFGAPCCTWTSSRSNRTRPSAPAYPSISRACRSGCGRAGSWRSPVHEVEVECLPQGPSRKDRAGRVRTSSANHSIHVQDISLPNVKILNSGDQVVALVKFAKIEAAPAVEEAEAVAGEGAIPAAGRPAPPRPGCRPRRRSRRAEKKAVSRIASSLPDSGRGMPAASANSIGRTPPFRLPRGSGGLRGVSVLVAVLRRRGLHGPAPRGSRPSAPGPGPPDSCRLGRPWHPACLRSGRMSAPSWKASAARLGIPCEASPSTLRGSPGSGRRGLRDQPGGGGPGTTGTRSWRAAGRRFGCERVLDGSHPGRSGGDPPYQDPLGIRSREGCGGFRRTARPSFAPS
ncbi:MAG: hypothetical protein M0C28_21985 [Candidatus Moduliflexus flocculans]|nr:hypothetical protein [Candidatus Moduliflexus flocculans]